MSRIKQSLDSGSNTDLNSLSNQCLKRENWLFKLFFTIPIFTDYFPTPAEEEQRDRLFLQVSFKFRHQFRKFRIVLWSCLGSWNFSKGL